MSLISSKQKFCNMLNDAFLNQLSSSVNEDAISDIVIDNLCKNLTDAIVYFVESGEINTNDTFLPGAITTSIYGVGIYSSLEKGTGKGKIICNNKDKLMNDLTLAYKKSKNNSTVDNPINIIEDLSTDIAIAIKNFLLQCTVTSDIITTGGTSVNGYITPAGIPISSISLPTTALGTGKLL